jgi:DNA helicase-2/ATP-dependent DNA helicase PcrA
MSFSSAYGVPQIDFRAALNDDQYAAVTAGDGPALVLAGAGSGKTRVLTYRVAWLLSQGVRPWEILLLTFTNKAAREMLTRVEDLTSVPHTDFWGGTFHSIGNRFLRRHAELAERTSTFTILDSDDSDALFSEVAKSADAAFFKQKDSPKPSLVLGAISFARNTRRPFPEVFKERFNWLQPAALGKLPAFAEAYRLAKKERNVCDYDDLLELWLRVLDDNPIVRAQQQRRFRYILVDEFQDTNKLQCAIVDALAANHQLMAVGDDAQCIYTWRGAEFANVAEFQTRHPGAQIFKIEINYRSTPEILNFANGILASQDIGSEYSKVLRPVKDHGAHPWLVPVLDASEQARYVARCVRGQIERGRELRDITVLYRAHYQAMELQMELTRHGIPFVITSGMRFFDQSHVRDLIAHLRFVNNPADTVAFMRLCALLPKIGTRTAVKILETARLVSEKTGTRLLAAFNDEKVLAKVPEVAREGFAALLQTLFDMEHAILGDERIRAANAHADAADDVHLRDAHVPLDTSPDAAANSPQKTPAEVTRIAIEGWYGDHIRVIYDNWQERLDDLKNLLSFAIKYDTMDEFLAQLSLLGTETDSKSTEPNADALRLTTIHQSKGLEFPVVLLLGCADELFPLKRAIERGDVEEERRLFYVAATRAMEELYLFYPKLVRSAGFPKLLEPSRFLQELPSDSYKIVHVR